MSSNLKAVEVLRDARAKIATPEQWSRKSYARDAEGEKISHIMEDACKFCAYGAVYSTWWRYNFNRRLCNEAMYEALNVLAKHTPGGCVIPFNDHPDTSHEDVLAVFDAAIASLEE